MEYHPHIKPPIEFQMNYKLYQIKFDNLKVSDDEIDELILYYQNEESYQHCAYLKKLKNK